MYNILPIKWILLLGLFGSLVLMLISNSIIRDGFPAIVIYELVMIVAVVIASNDKNQINKFRVMFITGLATFMMMSVVYYMYANLVIRPHHYPMSFVGHFLKMGLLCCLGVISSLGVSFLMSKISKSN